MRRLVIFILTLFVLGGILALPWLLLSPSHNRDWRDDYARVPQVHTTGDQFVIQNVRNWSYDPVTTHATDQAWITATITPSHVTDVHFLVEPFASWDGIAHTMLAFTFADGSVYIASVEARREKGERYHAFNGAIWPTYEYLMVWTTERDMYGNSRYFAGDQLYRYKLNLSSEEVQFVLMSMLEETRDIAMTPRWYHTLFANCTNVLATSLNQRAAGTFPLNKAWFFTGYAALYLYELGYLDTTVPFETLTEHSYLTPYIDDAYSETDPVSFSAHIRAVTQTR